MTHTQSMTYGTLPTREAFDAAFEAECPNGYRISLSRSDSRACDGISLGDGTWDADDLWAAINEITSGSGDAITVSEDEEWENVYQVFYPGTDCEPVEIGPDASELITWANRFSTETIDDTRLEAWQKQRAITTLNYASAYGTVGHDYTRQDARLDLVSSIMGTLGFEWV